MTRAEKRFRQGFRRITGREADEVEVRWFLHSPTATTAEEERAVQVWTLRMQDLITKQGRTA